MLLPYETAKAQRYLARIPIHMLVVVLVTLTVAVAPTLIYISFGGHLDHLLGRDKPVTATVENVEPDGRCGRSNSTEYRIEVSWLMDGQTGRGAYNNCRNAPAEGDAIQVWVGPTGNVENSSPAEDRAGLTAASLILAGLALWVGAWSVVSMRRAYQQLLIQGNGPLSEALPVELKPGSKGRIRMVHSAPQIMGTKRKLRVNVIIYNPHMASPDLKRRHKQFYGPWSLHLTHTSNRKRQVGLLVRDDLRCWILFRRR